MITLRRAAALLAAALALGACGSSGHDAPPKASAPAAASSPTATPSARPYLALGDSVVFGYTPTASPLDPAVFVGYPDYVARELGLALTNLGCPGETSAGFLSATGTDIGCRPYRSLFHLHTVYSGTQLDAAVRFLRAHPDTELVTVMLGANDLFACQRDTADHCLGPGELSAALTRLGRNLSTIYQRLREVYRGTVVAVTYYDPSGGTSAQAAGARLLDDRIAEAARAAHVRVADGYGAFARLAAGAHGDACAAGLLAKKSSGACDIHPSRRGAQALAQAVVTAVRAAG